MVQFELPVLGYDYNALEPFIDAKTMEIHYSKHHRAYLDKFNAAIQGKKDIAGKTAEQIVANWDKAPEDIRMAIKNNGGGFVNHNLFWFVMKKDVPFKGDVAEQILRQYGSFDKFKEQFSNAALTRFGSGWVWLVSDRKGNLEITSTANQDTPLSEGKIPVLTLDVWEHAYYLKYQNRRNEYVEAFFNVINWAHVDKLYKESMKSK